MIECPFRGLPWSRSGTGPTARVAQHKFRQQFCRISKSFLGARVLNLSWYSVRAPPATPEMLYSVQPASLGDPYYEKLDVEFRHNFI